MLAPIKKEDCFNIVYAEDSTKTAAVQLLQYFSNWRIKGFNYEYGLTSAEVEAATGRSYHYNILPINSADSTISVSLPDTLTLKTLSLPAYGKPKGDVSGFIVVTNNKGRSDTGYLIPASKMLELIKNKKFDYIIEGEKGYDTYIFPAYIIKNAWVSLKKL